MPHILITAFEPFAEWQANSSWLTLIELTKDLPEVAEIKTRLYPVDFAQMRVKLDEDLAGAPDFCLHLGQAAGTATIQLERFALNMAQDSQGPARPLVEQGPAAFLSELPLDDWCGAIKEQGIPAHVSDHAGTYLCNGIYYTNHYLSRARQLATKCLFVHLPLETSQTLENRKDLPSLPRELMAQAIRTIVHRAADWVVEHRS